MVDDNKKNFFSTSNESQEEAHDKIYGAPNHQELGGHIAEALKGDIDPETGKKKKDNTLQEILKIQDMAAWQKQMDGLATDMGEKIDELGESIRNSGRLKKAMDGGDIAELTIILGEMGRDIEGKTPGEILDMAKDEIEVQELTQATLIAEIKVMAEEYKTNMANLDPNDPKYEETKAEYEGKFSELRERAMGIEGLDFEKVFGDCFEMDADNKFYKMASDQKQISGTESVIAANFNKHAEGLVEDLTVDFDEELKIEDPNLGADLTF